MLREYFHYLLTPCPTAHRRLGYLAGLVAIQARYRRIGQHWQTHLDHSRRLIARAAALTPVRNKVVVLGSGLLLDVPVEMLAKQFSTVILVDVAHLIGTRLQCLRHRTVTLSEHDITGTAKPLLAYRQGDPLPQPAASLPAIAQDADLIISCNILSQLAITPVEYLQKHFTVDDDLLAHWQRDIVADHLVLLAAQSARRVVLCDADHDYLDRDGEVLYSQGMLHGANLGKADRQWRWLIAPLAELDDQYQLRATVLGFSDWSLPE